MQRERMPQAEAELRSRLAIEVGKVLDGQSTAVVLDVLVAVLGTAIVHAQTLNPGVKLKDVVELVRKHYFGASSRAAAAKRAESPPDGGAA